MSALDSTESLEALLSHKPFSLPILLFCHSQSTAFWFCATKSSF